MACKCSRPRPKLTVVIPARNEEKFIANVLQQLLDQDFDQNLLEILVADGRSEDRTREIVEQFGKDHPNILLVDNPYYTSGHGRNLGAAAAKGDFVLFVDGHCRIMRKTMLRRVLDAFEGGEKCISRPQPLLQDGVSTFQKAVALARSTWLGHVAGSMIFSGGDRHCEPMSAGCGYDLELFRSLGGVDGDFDAAEDLEFNFRVFKKGVLALHSSDFSIGYFPRGDLKGLFRQLFRYGFGRAKMAKKHPSTFSLAAATVALASLGFFVIPLAGLIFPGLMLYYLIGLFLYFGLTLYVAASGARKAPWPLVLSVWTCILAIHFGAGLGYLSGLVRGPSFSHKPPL